MTITNELLAQKIYDFITFTLPERQKNMSYYRTDQPVNKGRIIQGRPNNILRTNVCKYITDVHTGYFMGVPLTLDFNDDVLGGTFVKNMPRDLLYELLFSLSRDMSIFGTAFCLVYMKNGAVCASKQSPERAFTIYDDTLGHEAVASVRFSTVNKDEITGEVYVMGGRYNFIYTNKTAVMSAFEALPYDGISLIEFPNNEDKCGDFAPILSLMDAYNVLLSGAVDDMQSVSNAFLAIYGMQGTTREDIE
ncbi:MAG: phage portal protein, partial [Clostridia bacterium]|nr:phage portal protein [Clostridia bacterium]